MKLPGVGTNGTAFGAFVDVDVHQDGLVHVSQLADTFVKDPNEIVKVGQKVQVTLTEVDLPRQRIALSMNSKPDFEKKERKPGQRPQPPPTRRRHGEPLRRRLVQAGAAEEAVSLRAA